MNTNLPDNEYLVYILRKTSLTLTEIKSLTLKQFYSLYEELVLQEAQEKFERYSFYNVLLSTIHNAPITKPKLLNPRDFYELREPKKTVKPKDKLTELAENKGIKLPKS